MDSQKSNFPLTERRIRNAAMKRISEDFPLTEELLEFYKDELDWSGISFNRNIRWNERMIERWKNRIDWTIFSRNVDTGILTPNNIERFKDYWDWGELTLRLTLSCELIDLYIDRWEWWVIRAPESEHIVAVDSSEETVSPMDFLLRYYQHIPFEILQFKSGFWGQLVEEEMGNIVKEWDAGEARQE